MRKAFVLYLLSLSPTLLSGQSSGETSILSDTARLRTIRVIGSAQLVRQDAFGTTAYKLTAKELEGSAPARALDRLRFLPGIVVAPYTLGSSNIIVRGQEQQRLSVYYNGIPLRTSVDNGMPMMSFIFSNTDVELAAGGSSLVLGSNSTGSVIHFTNETGAAGEYGIHATAYAGNVGRQGYGARANAAPSSRMRLTGSVDYVSRSAFPLPPHTIDLPNSRDDRRTNSAEEILEASGVGSYQTSDAHSLHFTVLRNQGNYGYPPSTERPRFRRMTSFTSTMLGVESRWRMTPDAQLSSTFYMTAMDDTLSEYSDATFGTIRRRSVWYERSTGMRSVAQNRIAGGLLQTSVEVRHDTHKQDWFDIKAQVASNNLVATGEYRFPVFKSALMSSSVSYNLVKPLTAESISPALRRLGAVDYRIALELSQPTRNLMPHVVYSETTVLPRMRDLFGSSIIPNYIPNPDLRPERSRTLDVGVQWGGGSGKLGVSASLFANQVRDMLVDVRVTDTTTQAQNIAKVRIWGAEGVVKFRPTDVLSVYAWYVYSRAEDRSISGTSGHLSYRPEQQLSLMSSISPVRPLVLNLGVRAIGQQWYQAATGWATVDGFTTADVGAGLHLSDATSLWFRLSNALNGSTRISFDQPLPGREWRVGFNVGGTKSASTASPARR